MTLRAAAIPLGGAILVAAAGPLGGCGLTPNPPQPPATVPSNPSSPLEPVLRGELPWWHALAAGVYGFRGSPAVLAVGQSSNHHHVAEGYLRARVAARLGVRRAAESIAFSGPMPAPEMWDLFITRTDRFLALYRMNLREEDAVVPTAPPVLRVPPSLTLEGRHRIGRHVFERDRHLFLECEVEGPLANPDWGRDRASALLRIP